MKYADSMQGEIVDLGSSDSGANISNYQLAVLATLFEEADRGKVQVLAQQWGYQQELLNTIWSELHGRPLNENEPIYSEKLQES